MSKKIKGLGDRVAEFTEATGIKSFVEKVSHITKKPCNCDKRQETLNEWFPAKGMLKKDEYNFLVDFFKTYNNTRLESYEQKDMIYAIYNRVNSSNQKPSNCAPCLAGIIQDLKQKLQDYAA